ncbi:hypothetical protein ID866_4642 [Astraeus odoratus]|nr:hypothetical protein ID866_4642 [Astraeus odoratus]
MMHHVSRKSALNLLNLQRPSKLSFISYLLIHSATPRYGTMLTATPFPTTLTNPWITPPTLPWVSNTSTSPFRAMANTLRKPSATRARAPLMASTLSSAS